LLRAREGRSDLSKNLASPREMARFNPCGQSTPSRHRDHQPSQRACYRGNVAHHHRRFALCDVTFAGQPLPGATVDSWEDDAGQARWIARVVMRARPVADDGEFTGRMKDGGAVSGNVVVAHQIAGSTARRATIVEFHGSEGLSDTGPLAELTTG